jgi:hypothetical protein
MNEILTFLLALAGTLAWLPQIIKLLKKQELFGKIISRYYNIDEKQNRSFFLFKLSLLFKNKPFNIKDVECIIEYEDGQKFSDKSRNKDEPMRFNIPGKRTYVLQIDGKMFLNNFAVFPSETNITGFLYFEFECAKTDIKETIFIFKSFDNKEKKLIFNEKEIDEKQLLFEYVSNTKSF